MTRRRTQQKNKSQKTPSFYNGQRNGGRASEGRDDDGAATSTFGYPELPS